MSEFGPRPPIGEPSFSDPSSSREYRRPPVKSGFWKKLVLWTSVIGTMGVAGERLSKSLSSKTEKNMKSESGEVDLERQQSMGRDFEDFLHHLEDKESLQEALKELKDLQKLLEVQNLTQEYAPGSSERKKFDDLVEKELERLKKQLHHDPFWYDRLFKHTSGRLPVLVEEGMKTEVPLGVVLGIAVEESMVDQGKKSPSGKAVGIMQLEGPTAKDWQQVRIEEGFVDADESTTNADLRQDAGENIGIAAAGLHHLHDSFGRWDLTTLAYNNGRTATHRRLEHLVKDNPGLNPTYLDLLPHLREKTKRGKVDPHRGYPVRVEAKLRLFQEYYLPKLIANLENQLAK